MWLMCAAVVALLIEGALIWAFPPVGTASSGAARLSKIADTSSRLSASASLPSTQAKAEETDRPRVTTTGYWLAAKDGAVFAFGGAGYYGSLVGQKLTSPVVALMAGPQDEGYWLVLANGAVYPFGASKSLGSISSAASPVVAGEATPSGMGYWLVTADGDVYAFGDARSYGYVVQPLASPIVAFAATPSGRGYWLVSATGVVYGFGNAAVYGLTSQAPLDVPIVAIASTPSGSGYWLVASDGTVYAFGSAPNDGSAVGALNTGSTNPPAAVVPVPPGPVLTASTTTSVSAAPATVVPGGRVKLSAEVSWGGGSVPGGVVSFGVVGVGPIGETQVIDGLATLTVTVGGDGPGALAVKTGKVEVQATYAPSAGFDGSTGSGSLEVAKTSPASGAPAQLTSIGTTTAPMVGITTAVGRSGRTGYRVVSASGAVFSFGGASAYGDGPRPLWSEIVAITGSVAVIAQRSMVSSTPDLFPPGAQGTDVSNWQCGETLPVETLNVVEVDGESDGQASPCLAQEAGWQSGGPTELYTFITYGTQLTGPALCHGTHACDYGYGAAATAYRQAAQVGVYSPVWWLDVENKDQYWSLDPSDNAAVVRGAIDALQTEGVVVGIYSSHGDWTAVMGGSGYSPSVPEFLANWGDNTPPFDPAPECTTAPFASGTVQIVQYTNGLGTDGSDNDYVCR